jgi:hypothetical protein
MAKFFITNPSFVVFNFFYILLKFIIVHSIFWCFLSLMLTKSFCLEETILKSEFLEFYVFVGLTFITCCLLGVSAKALFFEKEESPLPSVIIPSDCSSNVLVVDKVLPLSDVVVDKVLPLPDVVVKFSAAENSLVQVPISPELKNSLFQFVRYELEHNTSKVPISVLVDFVSRERLNFILNEIETCKMIIRKYLIKYAKPGENTDEYGELIYRRFQRAKEEVSSYSHGERYDDWFYAASMLDEHRQTITLLMLALIEKPIEWIDDDTEAAWDLEIWQSYMFECRKNFAGASDALDYAEQLIKVYINNPEKFDQIVPVWHETTNVPSLKVIYLWDKMVESERAKKLLHVQSTETVISPSKVSQQSTPKVEALEQVISPIDNTALESSLEQTSFYNTTVAFFLTLKNYLISYFW